MEIHIFNILIFMMNSSNHLFCVYLIIIEMNKKIAMLEM